MFWVFVGYIVLLEFNGNMNTFEKQDLGIYPEMVPEMILEIILEMMHPLALVIPLAFQVAVVGFLHSGVLAMFPSFFCPVAVRKLQL